MTSFIAEVGDLEQRITATARLPIAEQGEALVAMYQQNGRVDFSIFAAVLIGELVHLRSLHRPPSQPSSAAQGALSVPS